MDTAEETHEAGSKPEAAYTSLPALLEELFRKFMGQGATVDLPAGPLEQRWRVVLGLTNAMSLYGALGEIDRALTRLGEQAECLPIRKARSKAAAQEIISAFRQSLAPNMLSNRVQDAATYVTEERLTRLGLLAEQLEEVAPECVPVEGIIPGFLNQLTDLELAIEIAPFPYLVKAGLRVRLDELRWAVTNWHLIGQTAATNAMGAMSIAVAQARTTVPPEDNEAALAVADIIERTKAACDWVGRIIAARDGGSGVWQLATDFVPKLLGQ